MFMRSSPTQGCSDISRKRSRRNEQAAITLHPIGLGDRDCELILSIPSGNYGAASFKPDQFSNMTSSISVPVLRLSQYAAEVGIEHLAFMKIDVEGFEREVVAGGANIITQSNPRAIIKGVSRHGRTGEVHRPLVGGGSDVAALQ
jgi:FkbM family methyltransferase